MNWNRVVRVVAVVFGLGAVAPSHAQELVVSAAASLTNAFREAGAAFEKQYPGVKVNFNFAASGPLLQQIENGAPVDVFASADQETVDKAQERKLVLPDSRQNFVSNRLVLIQPREATPIKAVSELGAPVVHRIAMGNPASVPVGRYARDVLQAEHLWEALSPKFILADSVRQVLDYVVRAEVDAGFVYATDAALAREKVTVVAVVTTVKPVLYPIAVVAGSRNPELARKFVAFASGAPEARAIYERFGFGKP